MRRILSTIAVAASVWAAALALSAPALAKDSVASPAIVTASTDATARAQATAPAVKRVRKVQPRRVAAVAAPAPQLQCFLFWCNAGGRPFNLLMLGVAY